MESHRLFFVLISAALLVGCQNSSTSFACDNGAGGMSESLCAQFQTQGSCESHAIVPDGGTTTLTCGATSKQFAAVCCELKNCKNTSFLFDDAGLPIDQGFPSPQCPPADAGTD